MAQDLIQLKQQLSTVIFRIDSLKEEINEKVKEGNRHLKRQEELELRIKEIENE